MNNNNTPIAANILIVDDEPNIRQGLKMSLKRDKHNIFTASDGVEAMKILNENEIDVVITDLKMPNMDGTTLMHKINESFFHIPVIVLTGHGDVETAVELMHDGAYDFSLLKTEICSRNLPRLEPDQTKLWASHPR